MAAKMAADFLENDCIHKISYHNMLLLGFWSQNDYIRYYIISLNIKNIFQGPENHTKLVRF